VALKGFLGGLLCAFAVVGCGGDSGGGSGSSSRSQESTPDVDVKTGYFIDAPVQGLSYQTNSRDGTTDALGRFEYLPGEKVVFSVGKTLLGAASASEIMTPGSLDETEAWDGPRAINIARLLITLDADQNPLNGIEITEAAHAAFADLEFDLSQSSETFAAGVALQRAVAQVGRVGLVSVAVAKNHLADMAQRLPEEPTEADIINLIDTGPNYSGRQTPMTATPDNLRQASQVVWADPSKPAPNLPWLVRAFDPDMLRIMINRALAGQAQPKGVRLYGEVALDDDGQFESADLLVSFDGYTAGDRTYRGSIYAQVSPRDGISVGYQPAGATEQVNFDLPAYEYGLFFDDLRVSFELADPESDEPESSGEKDAVTLGVHGWQSIVQTLDNPHDNLRFWAMDLSLRLLGAEQFLQLVTESPIRYSEAGPELSKVIGSQTEMSGTINVGHWALGAYTIDGLVETNAGDQQVTRAHLSFLDDGGHQFGELRTVSLPASLGMPERVRSEVFPTHDQTLGEFEVYLLETPLTGEAELTDAAPRWAFDYIRYEIAGDEENPTIPVGVVLKLPPISVDPDGDPATDRQFSWSVNGKESSADLDENGTSRLSLGLGLQSSATSVCFRNRTVYQDTVMEIALDIDLSKAIGTEHRVAFSDAACDTP